MEYNTGVTRSYVLTNYPDIDSALQKCFIGKSNKYANFIRCYSGKWFTDRVTWNNIFKVLRENGYSISIGISLKEEDRLTA